MARVLPYARGDLKRRVSRRVWLAWCVAVGALSALGVAAAGIVVSSAPPLAIPWAVLLLVACAALWAIVWLAVCFFCRPRTLRLLGTGLVWLGIGGLVGCYAMASTSGPVALLLTPAAASPLVLSRAAVAAAKYRSLGRA